MKLNGKIKATKAGVIGDPIEHSRSPAIHNYWLDKYKHFLDERNIFGEYSSIGTPEKNLKSKIEELGNEYYAGFNVTIPHKVDICQHIHQLSASAKRIGAVNTVVLKDNQIIGDNTDGIGFINNLKSHVKSKELVRDSALILGAGGAARAVLDGLIEEGFRDIYIANRTALHAESLIKDFENSTTKLHVLEWGDIPNHLSTLSLLVNTTCLGMVGKADLSLDLSRLSPKALVNDIVYNPLKTSILREAEHRGNPIIDGLGMLLHQAVPGFHVWFGKKPAVTSTLREIIMKKL